MASSIPVIPNPIIPQHPTKALAILSSLLAMLSKDFSMEVASMEVVSGF